MTLHTHLLFCLFWGADIFLSHISSVEQTSFVWINIFYLRLIVSLQGRHPSLPAKFSVLKHSMLQPGEQISFIPSGVTVVCRSNFNATRVAPAARAVSIWLSESAIDLQPFYWDCIKKAQPEPWFYGWAFPRSHWPDGYYEDKSNFHASTLIQSRGWSMTVCWRMAWLPAQCV